MKKHAYCILAHNEVALLKMLLESIDDERNDIYIHFDKKSNIDLEALKSFVKKSSLFFTERINVTWGGFSITLAEMILLKEAMKKDYEYFHILSGVDFPIYNQDVIHEFFDENSGQEMINFADDNWHQRRVNRCKYYSLLREKYGKKRNFVYLIDKILVLLQMPFVNRIKKNKIRIYGGSNFVSITANFVKYLLDNEALINKIFHYTICSDEFYLQTLVMLSPFKDNLYKGNLRSIDWKRGNPYTYDIDDYDELKASGNLFFRKCALSDEKKEALVKKIYREIKGENNEVQSIR